MFAPREQASIRILHLEDSAVDHELAAYALRGAGVAFSMLRVQTIEDLRRLAATREFDIVLADYRLPGFTAMDAWEVVGTLDPAPPFVILSGAIGEEAAVEAMRRGVSDYLLKDSIGKLPHVISRAIEVGQFRAEKARADARLAASEKRLVEFTAHLQSSIERERASIAREVHDDIGGALAALRFDLAWIERHSRDPMLQARLASANQSLQHALGASQRIMMDLRPAVLDQGLLPALQWLSDGFATRTGIRTVLHAKPAGVNLSKPVELVAYRTAQEALTNVTKHARCTEVSIDVSDAHEVLTLEISDNGQGIAQGQLDTPSGFGIKGLHERARTVGGWLDVTKREGTGTSVILTVPLHTGLEA
jgi:two-component system sensor histidine kinase UhpB